MSEELSEDLESFSSSESFLLTFNNCSLSVAAVKAFVLGLRRFLREGASSIEGFVDFLLGNEILFGDFLSIEIFLFVADSELLRLLRWVVDCSSTTCFDFLVKSAVGPRCASHLLAFSSLKKTFGTRKTLRCACQKSLKKPP